ncbi:MAG: DNA mismatch repair endonuclease MutL [Anaerolineae bacterium]
MPIQVLADDVAAKIAAGEVIERPVSVVKELIENALDAGATDVRVEIREGGQRLIRVADNGAGIPPDEVETAFQRHATSKLRSADDLFHIHTLGFRGEALPSIAAVSRVSLVTRTRDEAVGTRLRLDAGRVVERASVGIPAGTVITVENLFYNTPARLKFLKSATAEAGQIHTLLTHMALAYPACRFSLINDGRATFTHNGGTLLDSLASVYGVEAARQMIEIEPEALAETLDDGQEDGGAETAPAPVAERPVAVYGYISPPAVSRANRAHMTFIINGRLVQDRSLNVAVSEAYHTLLMVGRFPVVALHVHLPAEDVDVNVHPTKAEVRFRDGRAVFGAIQQAVRRVLLRHAPIPQFGGAPTWETPGEVPSAAQGGAWQPPVAPWWTNDPAPFTPSTSPISTWDIYRTNNAPPAPAPAPLVGGGKLPILRVIGQVAQAYIITEGPDGLYLIDQHAAHERILYEQFLARHAASDVARQTLLEPLALEHDAARRPSSTSTRPARQRRVHAGAVRREHCPDPRRSGRPARRRPRPALRDILTQVGEGRRNPLEVDNEAALLRAVCKTVAIKAGQTLSSGEMQALIQQLEACHSPRTCPHGRPTMIHLSAAHLEREFGRR